MIGSWECQIMEKKSKKKKRKRTLQKIASKKDTKEKSRENVERFSLNKSGESLK